MPIGAYKPKYVMEWAHTSPEEAVQGFHELNGKTFIPMHYGTFDLSDEPPFEPLKILDELHKNKALNGKLEVLKVGQEFRFTI
jgi:L-ascorbate metabolism protein UlaG (beta-lactamase superfamily)